MLRRLFLLLDPPSPVPPLHKTQHPLNPTTQSTKVKFTYWYFTRVFPVLETSVQLHLGGNIGPFTSSVLVTLVTSYFHSYFELKMR